MWDVILLLIYSCFTAVAGAPVTLSGHRGEKLDIRCSYESGYESNSKYFCKGDCYYGSRNIIVKSGSPAKDERFSLTDDTLNRVFTITITDLRTEDEGEYWCAVQRSVFDVYSEILLMVKLDKKTTEVSTSSVLPTTLTHFSTTGLNLRSTITLVPSYETSATGSVMYVIAGLSVMVIIFLLALTVLCKQRKHMKSQRVAQSGLPQQVSVGILPLNTRVEFTEEEFDSCEHKYQEISELQCMNKHLTTIYTTVEREDSKIYYTRETPEDLKIYYTADKPDDLTIYSTVDKPDDSLIYSTTDDPDYSLVYPTADKPADSLIDSSTDDPDDSQIYSTAY